MDEPASPSCPSCPQMLVATTMALMTAFAHPHRHTHRHTHSQPGASASAAAQRLLMARRIVANLAVLKEHPGLGAPLREVFVSAHALWDAVARQLEEPAERGQGAGALPAPGPAASRWMH